jgi:hypothetical protein
MSSDNEKNILRTLASQWMEFTNLPIMAERKRLWQCVKDLKAERPVILVETCMLEDYIRTDEIICEDPYLRNIEKMMRETIRHAEEIGDDIVLDPYFRIPWSVEISGYGVSLEAHHSETITGNDLGYSFDFAIQSPGDFEKLHLRNRQVNREETQKRKEQLEELFGDILPVMVGGLDHFNLDPGYHPWLGNLYGGLTQDLFKMIGNDRLFLWVYDEPDFIHKMMAFLLEDRKNHFRWMEEEGLLYLNTDTWNPCPGSYGFISELPEKEADIKLSDCWGWMESQETEAISPAMLDEFFLPYMAELSKMFGFSYYGCCERIDDRIETVKKAIPNLRAVSVSGWNDMYKAAELLGSDYVYSRKPTPAYISSDYPDWDLLKKDVRQTLEASRESNCSLEFCFRDIYTINGDRKRLTQWTEMTRSMFN